MRQVRLTRLETSYNYGTFGVLAVSGNVFCVTLEPYNRDNQRSISNIPAQQYICKRIYSRKYGWTFQVLNVPRRSQILIHAGNIVDHTRGCIILGQYFDKLQSKRAVLNSGNTFKLFMKKMEQQTQFQLTIVESY